jgi:hypothetical protein
MKNDDVAALRAAAVDPLKAVPEVLTDSNGAVRTTLVGIEAVGVDHEAVVPFEPKYVPFAPIASGVYAEVDEPTGIDPTAGAVAVPVPPLVTERVPTELARLLLAVMYH